jgi:hypothetical protein
LQTKIAPGHQLQAGQTSYRPVAPPVYRPEQKRIVQPKMASAAQAHTPPKAPPVYRPQAKPVSVQAKMSGTSQIKNHPVAPPVYRPQPVPTVLQTKQNVTQQGGQRQQERQRVTTPVPLAGRLATSPVNAQSAAKIPVHQASPKPATRFAASSPVGTGTVQRYVDASNSDITSSGKYYVERGNNDVLYSTRDAEPPEPRGLYAQGSDFTWGPSSIIPIPLNSWKPNVRFLNKVEAMAKPVLSQPGAYSYKTKGWFGSESSATYSVEGLQNEVRNPDTGWDSPPTVGALGANDCNGWATTLQILIADEKGNTYARQRGREEKRTVNIQSPMTTQADLNMNVGDLMMHIYNGGPCLYHAATVVAKDGNSLVTLEGHVSKDLSRPQFHIRGGLTDFAAEGIARNRGDQVDVTPVTSMTYEDIQGEKKVRENTFHRFSSDPRRWQRGEGTYESVGFLAGDIGITPTKEKIRRIKREDYLNSLDERGPTFIPPDVFPY